jgi:dynein heavy chain 1, cytosolic
MVWFSNEIVTSEMIFKNYFLTLQNKNLEDGESFSLGASTSIPTEKAIQVTISDILSPYFQEHGLVARCLEFALKLEHIMEFTVIRVLGTLFSLLNKAVRVVIDYNANHTDFPLTHEQVEQFMKKTLVICIVWSFAGDSKLENRTLLGDFIRSSTSIDMPLDGGSLIDFDVNLVSGEWHSWQSKVPTIDIETYQVTSADIVIPVRIFTTVSFKLNLFLQTLDTLRHEEVLYSWLSEHKPLILCGPPGSGKTMTLFAALRKLPQMVIAGLNFSSATSPELILKTIDQYCEYKKTPSGVVLSPKALGSWLVLFCDEINLPAKDKYGTQRVISFMRQLIEYNGFWRTSDKVWVKLERIQFVGACNPPTDPGRVPLSSRFLRHAPLIMVDYPGDVSLMQIYNTFSRATLKLTPNLRGYSESLTRAMVEVYSASQNHFTPDVQAHYIYSPRELTRWIRGIYEIVKACESLTLEELIRIWAHEGLRLFRDRLVNDEERTWTDQCIDNVAMKQFPKNGANVALERPILFSNWISKTYSPVDSDNLREFVKARLKVFYEEEMDVPLVLFNDVLEHVLRIDRVFRQPQGHMLLIGISGSGKVGICSSFFSYNHGM